MCCLLLPAVHLDKQVSVPGFRSSLCRHIFFYEERREFGLADLLQRFNNNESGEVCCLILRVWFWEFSFIFLIFLFFFEDAIYAKYFSFALRFTTHHGFQLVLEMYQGGNPFALVETGIHDHYTRAECRLWSRCQFLVLGTGKIPILPTQLTLSYRLLAPNKEGSGVFCNTD